MTVDEPARLRRMEAYRLFDSDPIPVLDEVVTGAARLTGLPVAMIGFPDGDSEHVKAAFGWKTTTSLPARFSFAACLKSCDDAVVVDDASADPRFAQHPLVTSSPYVRFFAGVPLIDDAGVFLGALWLADRVPRRLHPEIVRQLVLMARLTVAVLIARRERLEIQATLAESNDRFRDFFDRTADLIVSIGADGRLLHVNEAVLSALGFAREEIVNAPLTNLIDPAMRDEFSAVYANVIASGEATVVETVFVTGDDRRVTVEGSLQPKLIDGRAVLTRVIFHDISERKGYEAELSRARDAALESARLKTQFLTNVSHEIRTPMNGIIGMVDLLLATKLDYEQQDFAHQARAAAEQLLSIVNNILHVSAIEAGSLTSTSIDFDLPRTLQRIVEVMRIGALGKELEISLVYDERLPAVLRGSQARVRQVVTNLMENAVKFTEQGFVILRAALLTETDTHRVVRFEVTDTGIGISAEDRLLLFEKFSQIEATSTRRFSGVGLGLATARHLVETMGGLIDVESVPGTGSMFWFTIPFPKTATSSQVDLAGRRVLLIDSHAQNRRVVRHYLEAWSIHVDEQPSAQAPDIVVFDDLSIAGRLGGAARLYIAPNEAVDAERLRELGIDAYVVRPVGQSELFDALTIAIARQAGVPKPEPAPAAHPQLPVPAQLRESLRVLLVEDNFLNMKLTMSQLEKLGYAADSVANGKEAVEAVRQRDYGVILMDCQMPIMDGYEATMEIRKLDGRDRRRRIVALTANALAGEREKCLAAGMDDYLSKPTRAEELEIALARFFT